MLNLSETEFRETYHEAHHWNTTFETHRQSADARKESIEQRRGHWHVPLLKVTTLVGNAVLDNVHKDLSVNTCENVSASKHRESNKHLGEMK